MNLTLFVADFAGVKYQPSETKDMVLGTALCLQYHPSYGDYKTKIHELYRKAYDNEVKASDQPGPSKQASTSTTTPSSNVTPSIEETRIRGLGVGELRELLGEFKFFISIYINGVPYRSIEWLFLKFTQ